MSPELVGVIGVLALIVLLFARMWIGFAMALVGFIGLVYLNDFGRAGIVLGSIPFSRVSFYPISALPLFCKYTVTVWNNPDDIRKSAVDRLQAMGML